MNNTATNTATCLTVRKQIGKTTYIVRVHFSQTAKCDFFLNLMKKSLTFRLWGNEMVFLQAAFVQH